MAKVNLQPHVELAAGYLLGQAGCRVNAREGKGASDVGGRGGRDHDDSAPRDGARYGVGPGVIHRRRTTGAGCVSGRCHRRRAKRVGAGYWRYLQRYTAGGRPARVHGAAHRNGGAEFLRLGVGGRNRPAVHRPIEAGGRGWQRCSGVGGGTGRRSKQCQRKGRATENQRQCGLHGRVRK